MDMYQQLYLQHHGIKGQKWGVRNGPPYPLGAGQHSARERRLSGSGFRGNAEREIQKTRQKYDKIGDSGTSLNTISNDARAAAKKYGFSLKSGDTITKDAKSTNPGWWDRLDDERWSNNCSHCVVAFAARRRGLDVVATPMTKEQGKQGGVSLYDTCKRYFKGDWDETDDLRQNRDFHYVPMTSFLGSLTGFDSLTANGASYEKKASVKLGETYKDAPNGAYGIAEMRTVYGGHVFSWYKEDGIIKFADPQSSLNARQNFNNLARYGAPRSIQYLRLDDRELNLDHLGEVVAPAKSSIKHSIIQNDIWTLPVDTLAHHGIKGQKWGVRNGPPYPLGAGQRSSSERRASNSPLDKVAGNAYSKKRQKSPSALSKAVKVGAVAALAGVAAYGLYKSGALDSFSNQGYTVARGVLRDIGDTPFSDLRPINPMRPSDIAPPKPQTVTPAPTPVKLDAATGFKLKPNVGPRTVQSIAEDALAANPDRSHMNCVACTVTMDLRARGFDVCAKTKKGDTTFGIGELDLLYDDFKREFHNEPSRDIADAYQQVTKKLSDYGNGARGIFLGVYDDHYQSAAAKRGGESPKGHAIFWEVLNGSVIFSDGQDGRVYSDPLQQIIRRFDKDNLSWGRLDNLEIDPEFAFNFAKNR